MKLLMIILIASVWLTCYTPAPHCTPLEFQRAALVKLRTCKAQHKLSLKECSLRPGYVSWTREHYSD